MTESAIAPTLSHGAGTPLLTLVDRPAAHRSGTRGAITVRECRVLALLADGLSTREVAREMAYSERTIKNILQTLTSRLHLRNRTQAVAYAVRRGWI